MTQRTINVLRVNEVEEREEYRSAVAEILRNVQNDYGVTLLEIAETIGVSLGTISNAANKKADLSATFLQRIGRAYAPTELDPYYRLSGGRAVARANETDGDIMPLLLRTGAQIATARCPSSPGGVSEVLRERLGYLPDLRRLRRETDALIALIEAERDAA
ncbi:helix-turn-helix domain-containing protein [Sphingobium sp. CCH11-B1]|uniref:helix-turn-helix domain-containing protein n=1 Tax=Sphingobium sp. CCH11-B1 TaxID=1768781 RepID=UPI000835E7AA|nr:helix-turn-helix transcriptional regulator [Sphingobium sp. CCH11-B1]